MPEFSQDLTGGIGQCPSPTHRGVLGLVRAAVGCPVGPTLGADLRASDPDDLVRIATNAYVHVVLATGFERVPDLADAVPRDLVIFFSEMQAANLRRNEAIRVQIETVGEALCGAGLRGIVLKGGAELLDPRYPDPALRFLSDIDILVPGKDIERAAQSLHAIGALADPENQTDYRDHHHFAQLIRPDWPVPVELHRQLYAERRGRGRGLDDSLRTGAEPSGLAGLDLPAAPHRLAHAVFHAQVQSSRYRMRELSLRDALEFEILSRSLAADHIAAAAALYGATDRPAAWDALDAARCLIFGSAAEIEALPEAARAWADAAITAFGRPGHRTATTSLWLLWGYVEDLLLDPGRRRHFIRQLTRRGGLRRTLDARRDRFRRIR